MILTLCRENQKSVTQKNYYVLHAAMLKIKKFPESRERNPCTKSLVSILKHVLFSFASGDINLNLKGGQMMSVFFNALPAI